MGNSFKGSNGHSHSQRGKPYALMLLLAFGAAILGVMVLHKLREKRIFTVLVNEKDHELLTLHLLFQREKEFNKEARRKIEEMKAKLHSLRSQKIELDRKLLDMESTVQSLRDERKVIESALEEKRNEIKMLTEEGRTNSSSEVLSQVASLKETIKMQEGEIEELKFLLEKAVDVHSASTNLSTDIASLGTHQERVTDIGLHQNSDPTGNSTKDEHGSRDESIIQRENKSDKLNDEEGGAAGAETELASNKQEVQRREYVINGGTLVGTDKNPGNKTTDSQSNQGSNVTDTTTNETSTGHDESKKGEQRARRDDESKKSMDGSDSSHDQEGQGYSSFHEGGQKVEKSDGSDLHGLGSRVRRRHSKGKRWRDMVRNRRMEHSLYSVTNGAEALNKQENEATGTGTKREVAVEPNQTQGAGSDTQARKQETNKADGGHDQQAELVSEGKWGQDDKGNINREVIFSGGEKPKVRSVEDIARKQKSDEIISYPAENHEASGKPEKVQRMEVDKHENDSEQLKVENEEAEADKHENDSEQQKVEKEEAEAEDVEDAETHEPEIDKADIQRFSESDHEEETEEPEF